MLFTPWNQNPAATAGHVLHAILQHTSPHQSGLYDQLLLSGRSNRNTCEFRYNQSNSEYHQVFLAFFKIHSRPLTDTYSELQHFKASLARSQCEGCSKKVRHLIIKSYDFFHIPHREDNCRMNCNKLRALIHTRCIQGKLNVD